MPSLADLLENYRNWKGRQDWQSGKEMQDYFGGDPVAQEQFEQLSGFGTGSHGVGGLAGMIKASHGSPHAFEKFDFSKIGTGEGAQAYGHGGYFGQGFDSPVAQKYAKDLANIDQFTGLQNAHANAKNQVARFGDDPEWAAEVIADTMRNYDPKDMEYTALADTLKFIKSGDYTKPLQNEGHLYNVELKWPNAAREASDPLGEHHLLDWDARLSEQSEAVRSKLLDVMRKRGFPTDESGMPLWASKDPTGEAMYASFNPATAKNNRRAQELASQLMRESGIPGIRYLDQASRGQGAGTRNYVMFDDQFPEIVSRNGVSLSDLLRK